MRRQLPASSHSSVRRLAARASGWWLVSRAVDWRLYVLLDAAVVPPSGLVDVAGAAIQGGATVLQLRAKALPLRDVAQLAQALLPIASAAGVPLLINDHVALALALGADGVHLGVDDLPVRLARQLLPEGLIGYSPERLEDAVAAVAEGADYLGVGPFAATSTKLDAGAPIGPQGIRALAQRLPVPIVAVGGIGPHNAASAVAAGAAGVAVASAVIAAPDPAQATQTILKKFTVHRLEPARSVTL